MSNLSFPITVPKDKNNKAYRQAKKKVCRAVGPLKSGSYLYIVGKEVPSTKGGWNKAGGIRRSLD